MVVIYRKKKPVPKPLKVKKPKRGALHTFRFRCSERYSSVREGYADVVAASREDAETIFNDEEYSSNIDNWDDSGDGSYDDFEVDDVEDLGVVEA